MSPARGAAAIVVILIAALSFQAPASAAEFDPPLPRTDADAATVLNYYRALAGAQPVTVDSQLSDGAREHALYMVKTGHFAHDQAAPSEYQSEAGRQAAENGNLYASSGALSGTRWAVDGWADSLGHGLNMLNPRLRVIGFGQHVDPMSTTGIVTASVLDVFSATQAEEIASPLSLPRHGSIVSRRVLPEATEGHVATCPDFPAGSPVLMAFLPVSPSTPSVSITRDGVPVETCSFSAENYTNPSTDDQDLYRAILEGNRAAVIVIRGPLSPGSHYEGSLDAGSQSANWSFDVADEPGYWLLTRNSRVFGFGAAEHHGDFDTGLAAVDIAPTPTAGGYWVMNERGWIGAFGDAPHLGDAPALAPGETAVSLAATPTGAGYWIFTTKGRALPYGDAPSLGDLSGVPLNGPVLDSIATPTGRGYYLVASDGGVFSFGDAGFRGSMGGVPLNAPVQSLVPDPDGLGYWLVASDGGIFAFDAHFRGSMGGMPLNRPITGMVAYGDGYVLVGEDGGVFTFGDSPFLGSFGDSPPASPVVAIAAI